MTLKPLLKWVGGKSQVISQIIPLFPSVINNYYEPFLGGGSVLLALLSEIEKGNITVNGTINVSDNNINIINFYQTVKNKPKDLIKELNILSEQYSKCNTVNVKEKSMRNPKSLIEAMVSQESYYYWIRTLFNNCKNKETPSAAAFFLFLNKTGFRGLYREGPNGFNVPFGNYKNPSIYEEKYIDKLSYIFNKYNVQFTCSDFKETLSKANPSDFIYLDPPYYPENATSFVKYSAEGFTDKSHSDLFAICHQLHKDKIPFILSNSDVSRVRDEFEKYSIKQILAKRTINSKNPESHTIELIISNMKF
jgi:DNA adenine methylase